MNKKDFSNKEKWWIPKENYSQPWKGTWRDDWRILNQELILMDVELEHRRFDRSICFEDYLQCEFCSDTFDDDPDNIKLAYFDPIHKVWVCQQCFNDFQKHFHWTVKDIDTDA